MPDTPDAPRDMVVTPERLEAQIRDLERHLRDAGIYTNSYYTWTSFAAAAQGAAPRPPAQPTPEVDVTIAEIITEFFNRGANLQVGETRKAVRSNLRVTKTKYNTVLLESLPDGAMVWAVIGVIGTEPHPIQEAHTDYCFISRYGGHERHIDEVNRLRRTFNHPAKDKLGQQFVKYMRHFWGDQDGRTALGPYSLMHDLFRYAIEQVKLPNPHVPPDGQPIEVTEPNTEIPF